MSPPGERPIKTHLVTIISSRRAAPLQHLIVSFILPVANAARPSSFELRRLLRAWLPLIVSVKRVVFTWVVLGFVRRVAELNVKVDAEDGVVAVVPGD